MTPVPARRFGIDARWLEIGPPSGRNYVRHVVAELAAGPDANAYVAFVRRPRRGRAGDGSAARPAPGIARIAVPNLPAIAFNGLGIPARTPRDVVAVAYQHFTPPVSRAGRLTIIHDLIYLTSPERFSAPERAYLGLIARLLPAAEAVATVSDHVREQVLERWPRRDPASVVVAPNGVDEALLAAASTGNDPAEVEARRRLGLVRPYVLYLGRLNTRKNLPGLIRGFAAADLPDLDLVLAGAPSGIVEDLVAIGRTAGLGDRLRLPGAIADADLAALYRGASAFAYLSFDEGFGVPPLEAMAFGLPVVVSDIAALRETAAAGGAALVAPADVAGIAQALRCAVLDTSVRAAAAERGPAHARTYRWSVTVDRLRAGLELAAA